MLHRRIILIVLSYLAPGSLTWAAEKVTYENDVRPILREHCFACHNQDDATASLALDSFEGLTTGGASGEVISAGDLDGSRLWKLVTHQEEPQMPPGDKLPEPQLKVLRAWIEGGLLKDASSKPLKSSKPTIAKLETTKLGKPVGEPAMPELLFHEPVLWTPNAGPVDAIATSPWAPLAAVGWQRQVSFYDTNTHELLGIIPYVDGVPRVVRFSRDGSLVLVAGGRHAAAGRVALFDVKTGVRLATLGDELDIVLAADISPDLSLVALGGPRKKVRVFRVSDGSLAYQISKHTDWITAVGFSPDGRLLATADRNGGALLWQASAGHERADLRGHKRTITSLDWRADSAMLATASEDGTVRLWNPAGKQIKSVEAHKSGVLSVRFAKDGKWVTAGRDHKIKTWKPDGGAIADLGQLPGMALAATFTHDGSRVLASDYTGEVRLFGMANKKHIATLQANPPRLAQRLADAENKWQGAKQKLQTSEQALETQLAALEQGKADHVVHEDKLKQTEAALATERKKHEEIAKLHANHAQQVTSARQTGEQAAATLAAARVSLEQAQAESSEAPEPELLTELQQRIDEAQTANATAKEKAQQAEESLATVAEQQLAAEKSAQAAESKLAQVSNETKGLPDLKKLTAQHVQAQAAVEATKLQLQNAQRARDAIVEQQTRFAKASAQFASDFQQREAEQQELVKQSGRLEVEHRQAANQLANHRTKLTRVGNQLKAIQARLDKLESAETTLQEQELKLGTELEKIQAAQSHSQQQAELLETSKRDFIKANELRKAYASDK